jgi:hypothetical protein
MMPYMTDNVVVFSEYEDGSSEMKGNLRHVVSEPKYKLASQDPQVLLNNVLDQAVDAYKQCYVDLDSDQVSDTLRGICQGFAEALRAMLSGEERDADVIIEELAS